MLSLRFHLALVLSLVALGLNAAEKPTLLYTRYFNAKGETRYLPEGNYKEILEAARKDFNVIADGEAITPEKLKGVNVVLIANPSAAAIGNNPAPNYIEGKAREVLDEFIKNGGGVILMGNQEDHNLETNRVNQWTRTLGLEFQEQYSDAKKLVLPRDIPAIGGLRWAYYTGNLVTSVAGKGKVTLSVQNDLQQSPIAGKRDQKGMLLAGVDYGKGRVLLVTDSGWITTTALNGEGIGGVAIKEHDNVEIFLRLAKWAAGK